VVEIDFEKGKGLLPVIVQDYETGEVLMLAYMNRKAWLNTLETGKATYWSRSRNELWVKGETSGHVQIVKEILVDCDSDTLLLKVQQIGGAACHTGYKSCFYRKVTDGKTEIIGEPVFEPKDVYK
jgi:phosphoribosyl-AMP cyclohydrolase